MNLKPVFENEYFIVLDKEAGVLTTPARFADDPRPCLGTELQRSLGQQIFPVHRLDYEVSGLVLYALTAESHRAANGWFENKQIQKTYRGESTGPSFDHWPKNLAYAQIEKLAKGDKFTWQCRLLKGKKRSFESPQGKEAVTQATYLGVNYGHHEWDLNPITGRSHQLRYELSRHGFPIVGDALYGSKESIGVDRIALRSYLLSFTSVPDFKSWGLPAVLEVAL
jgi:tRNA pseudouridine32 synthase/23S rRNA pseudouridine746 synthase